MALTVEEALRQVEDKAALIRFGADGAAGSQEPPGPAVLSGLRDVCGEIEELVRTTRESLNVEALATEPTRRRR